MRSGVAATPLFCEHTLLESTRTISSRITSQVLTPKKCVEERNEELFATYSRVYCCTTLDMHQDKAAAHAEPAYNSDFPVTSTFCFVRPSKKPSKSIHSAVKAVTSLAQSSTVSMSRCLPSSVMSCQT